MVNKFVSVLAVFSTLLSAITVSAQSTIYQSFEVDSAAQPHGGMAYLTTFVQANLRKPVAAEAKGIGGMVVVGGTVEADGRVTEVNVMKSLRPDCDQEAVRVFKRYNAWKPAQKAGKAVRQRVSIPVSFATNVPFTYQDGKQILYFDADLTLLTDSTSAARFKQVNPVDTNGIPNGHQVLLKFINNRWEDYARDSLVRTPNGATDELGQPILTVGYQGAVLGLNGCRYTIGSRGEMLSEQCYRQGKQVGAQLYYHPNGVLARREEELEKRRLYSYWYPNGQIHQIVEKSSSAVLDPSATKVTAYWDSTGRQTVKNGNGLVNDAPSRKVLFPRGAEVPVKEQGAYKNYFKEGMWTGHSVDSVYFYEENYKNGVLTTSNLRTVQKGTNRSSGDSSISKNRPESQSDTTLYYTEDRPPVFPGGQAGWSRFLSTNLRYPSKARNASIQGQVVLSFTVCTDGTLCDYVIVNRVDPSIDKEALRVVQKTSGQWQPGIRDGQKTKAKFTLPINFTLTR